MSTVSIEEAALAASSDEALAEKDTRDKKIVRTSVVGIVANVFLAAFKAVIGVMSSSIAITMDAINNLSHAASSIITIVGTKLAGKLPDKEHPLGYGRIEYLSAMVISLLVLYAGITSLQESVQKIVHPEAPRYTTVALVIVAVGVLVKIFLGRYVKGVGVKVNSQSLINSGEDATLDSVISASTLVAALIFVFTGVSLESWLGAIISLVIVKSGIDMLRETLSQILGECADIELARKVKHIVGSFPEVLGVYDLILNNYGPDSYNGSVHIEVADTMTADQIDVLTRSISVKVACETGVFLTAVNVYAHNTQDPQVVAMRTAIEKAVFEHDHILQMHGFYVDLEAKTIRLDLVVSFDENDRRSLFRQVIGDVKALYPDFALNATMDTDFTEQ